MAKLAKVNTSDDTNWLDSAVSGMNAGLGVASFMNDRKVQKKQMEQYDREAAEWDMNDPVRKAEREGKLLNAELSKLDVTGKTRLAQATLIGNLAQDIEANPNNLDLQSQSDLVTRRFNEITGGGYGFSTVPMKDHDGNSVYEATITGPNGYNKKMTYKDGKGLSALINQGRHDSGAYNVSELQQFAMLKDGAGMFLNGLTDAQKKQFGVTDVKSALANRDFMAAATNALSQNMSASQYMEQSAEQGRNADNQGMKVEEHGWKKDEHGMSMQVSQAQLANAKQVRAEASARFNSWKDNLPAENQDALNRLNKGTVEYFEAVKGSVAGMYKPDEPLMGDDGQPNGKFGYSKTMTNKINAITMLASKAKDGTNPLDAIQAAMVTFEEKDAADKAKAAAEEAARLEAEATAKKGIPSNADDKDSPGHVANKSKSGFGAKKLTDAEGIAAREKAAYDADAQSREDEARYIEEREAERQRIYNDKYRNTQGYGVSWKR